MSEKIHHIHLVSDATGETINTVVRACLAQFSGLRVEEHFWNLIRSKRQLDLVGEGLIQWPGLVLYTFVDKELQKALITLCRRHNLTSLAVLDPVMSALARHLGTEHSHDPGRQHTLDADYYNRIDAMDFALALDDGNKQDKMSTADVLILGVSRTSKTPTCLYLANRGIKAANIPLIPDIPVPPELFTLQGPLIVGLTKDPDSLVEIRRNRIRTLHGDDNADYVDIEKVRDEVLMARRLFARLGCPVIDVTRRSIEETAAEILMLFSRKTLEKQIAQHKEAALE